MKKLILSLSLCVLLLAACSSDPGSVPAPSSVPAGGIPAPSPSSSLPAATSAPRQSSGVDSVASATSEAKTISGTVLAAMVGEVQVQADAGDIYTFAIGDDTVIEPEGTTMADGDTVTLYYYGEMVPGALAQDVHVVRITVDAPAPV